MIFDFLLRNIDKISTMASCKRRYAEPFEIILTSGNVVTSIVAAGLRALP